MKWIFLMCLIFLVSCTANNSLNSNSFNETNHLSLEPDISNILISTDPGYERKVDCYNAVKNVVISYSNNSVFDELIFYRMDCKPGQVGYQTMQGEGVTKDNEKFFVQLYVGSYSLGSGAGPSKCFIIGDKIIVSESISQGVKGESPCKWIN